MDVHPGERIKNVRCTRDSLRVDLLDGRTIIVPLAWYPRLLHATASQRANWMIGYCAHDWRMKQRLVYTTDYHKRAVAPMRLRRLGPTHSIYRSVLGK